MRSNVNPEYTGNHSVSVFPLVATGGLTLLVGNTQVVIILCVCVATDRYRRSDVTHG